jgi:hypothetical protein
VLLLCLHLLLLVCRLLTAVLGVACCMSQVLSNPNSFDVAVTTYEMVNSADFGRPIQTSIVSSAVLRS